ncbi:hypothetical protein [Lacipirellula limnantheis]|uniref:Uncharacterized protein n=1 Tax=Lacipirellula limnantheis TaxID=2528024 RepID=A0A517TWH9_9BACT|nr:hypothetical protein [Lacipirellula limnantheis]QDT72726.1 hypothetical protein I41_19080 [Lacipirellula limnantheis]
MKLIRLVAAASLMAAGAALAEVRAQQPAAPAVTPPTTDERYTEGAPTPEQLEAQRLAIWDSKEMVEAREWLVDHMARSARITPSQSKRYMDELERLNAEQLKLWLMTFEEQQAERARQRDSFERARRQSVDNAMRENQATQQAAENINRTRTEAAKIAQESLQSMQQQAQERSRQLVSDRDAAATAALQSSPYIWLNTLPWGPYAGYPVGGGAAIDPAAFQGVLGVRERQGTVAPGTPQSGVPIR